MNNVTHYPKISTVSQPEIVLIRTDDFLPSKLTVRLIVCLFWVSTSGLTSDLTSGFTSGLTSGMMPYELVNFRWDFPNIWKIFLVFDKNSSSCISWELNIIQMSDSIVEETVPILHKSRHFTTSTKVEWNES